MIGFRWYWALKHSGDLLAQTSLPENYFKNTGEKLIGMDNHHFFDYNPFVIQARDVHPNTLNRVEVRDIWRYIAPNVGRDGNDKTMAHQKCRWWGLNKCYKTNPDIYLYHEFETNKFPRSICIAPQGQTNGCIPLFVLNFIREKYRSHHLFQIGLKKDVDANVDFDRREIGFFESCKLIAECETMITVDSLPMWMCKMYPSTRLKIILANKSEEECEKFMPIGFPNDDNHWSGWIECGAEYYNCFDQNMGITKSYLDI